MKELQVINIKGIDCYEKDGVAYLKLETVARGLGFTQEKNGVEYVKWERVESYLAELGFPHKWGKGDFIPENIFYRLAMKAKNETAEKFQALVADEIIPSIRKTGSYSITPKDYPTALRALADEVEKRQALEAENKKQKETIEIQNQVIEDYTPKVSYYDTILQSQDAVTVTQIAADYGMSPQELNKILHEEGVQHKVGGQWVLYREHMGKGFTKSHTHKYKRSDGSIGTKILTKWTQKGRLEIFSILDSLGIHALMDLDED